MKILFVHERYLPDSGGGGEALVHQRARALSARGHDIQVIASGDPDTTNYEGVPIQRVCRRREAFPLATPYLISAAIRADIVHTFTYYAALPAYVSARLTGTPVICEYLALFGRAWSMMRSPLSALARRRYEQALIKTPFDAKIFLSEASRQLATENGMSGERSHVVPPGVDLEFFRHDVADSKENFVLFAAKFEKRKGIADLLAVAQACPDVKFLALGWGPETDALAAAAPSNLTVRVGRGEIYASMLRRARIFFCPSHAETFGLAVVEAMASGCAVVSTTSQDYCGVRVAPGDVKAMVEAIRMLWTNPALSIAWGNENRRRACQYSSEASCEAIVSLYASLIPATNDRKRP